MNMVACFDQMAFCVRLCVCVRASGNRALELTAACVVVVVVVFLVQCFA